VDRALLGFDGFFSDSVGGVPYGRDDVRDSGPTLWAVGRGSAFEVGIIVSLAVSEKVRTYVSLRECGLAVIGFREGTF
jgi:hypothetical protein